MELSKNVNDIDKLNLDVTLIPYRRGYIVDPDDKDNDICRTIKAQYWKNSISNIFHKGTFGCTGVIEIENE